MAKITLNNGMVIEGTPEELEDLARFLGVEEEVEAEECEAAREFKVGDRVKALRYGEYDDIKTGDIGVVEIILESSKEEGDPYYIDVYSEKAGTHDFFRPQDLELVEEEPYKPSEGDIVVITGNTNHSRNAIGDIGKVGLVWGDGADVDVPGKTEGNGNYTLSNEMRPATDEEKAKYKQAVKFTELGRKPGEFKKGDIVRVLEEHHTNSRNKPGDIGEIESANDFGFFVNVESRNEESLLGNLHVKGNLELIAPVESRVDVA